MRKPISFEQLTDNLQLSENHATSDYRQGFWVYDEVLRYNIVMAEPIREKALIAAITEYQERYASLLQAHKLVLSKVETFISQFTSEE